MSENRGAFNTQQVTQLLTSINPVRVLQANGQSHVSQQDVTAHLIRVFGFGNFDTQIMRLDELYTNFRTDVNGKPTDRWDSCYLAVMRLTVRDENGNTVCVYENGSTGDSSNQKGAAAAHDLAMKSAISLATKRCAINLGDQFGLSLYNKGQTSALVIGTIIGAGQRNLNHPDVQDGVDKQESLGIDETHYGDTHNPVGLTEEQQQDLSASLGAKPIEPGPTEDQNT